MGYDQYVSLTVSGPEAEAQRLATILRQYWLPEEQPEEQPEIHFLKQPGGVIFHVESGWQDRIYFGEGILRLRPTVEVYQAVERRAIPHSRFDTYEGYFDVVEYCKENGLHLDLNYENEAGGEKEVITIDVEGIHFYESRLVETSFSPERMTI
jgi:hypothetical protein